MTVVGVPAPFISVDIAARSIAVATCRQAAQDALAASAQQWEERLNALVRQKTLTVYDFDTLRRSDVGDLPPDRVVVKVDDLNECAEVASAGLTFEVRVDEDERAEELANLLEILVNGHPINWRYWIGQLNTLTADEAARLMCALDPDVYVTLDERLKNYDASKEIANFRQTVRLALRSGMDLAKPTAWLKWASDHEVSVHPGFTIAVLQLQREEKEWAEEEVQNLRLRHELDQAFADDPQRGPEASPTSTGRARNTPVTVKKGIRQQDRILEWLKDAGHEPTNLGERPPGAPGPKSACKTALLQEVELFSDRSFEKAWTELRRLKLVQGAD